jgi:hypothetical protein
VARWIRESTRGQYDRFGPASQREQQDRFIERCGLVDTGLVFQVAHSCKTVWKPPVMSEMLETADERRFEPNGLWQSDVTHWRLADGSEVEICSWLDDHSRYLLGCTAFGRVSGDDVVATFTTAGDTYGWPAATLTDNGAVYTSRFTGGRNAFESLLAYLGIRQKNGAPGHPQTQGKIERFHQTLKRWLGQQPAARTLAELQAQLDAFRIAYDEQRPHRAIGRVTPGEAYRATPKAHPAGRGAPGHFRLRYDVTDAKGGMTLRRGGRLHHLAAGVAHARQRVLAIVDEHEVTVVALDTGEVLSSHRIEPERSYWRNQRRDPGRWPGSQAT